jgi:hypothetical protein
MKYNLRYKHKNWIDTLALEADAAISILPTPEQEHTRHLVAQNIKTLYNKQRTEQNDNNTKAIREKRTLNNIKKKLNGNNATITKADKGNTIVITYLQEYHDKTRQFIIDNNFTQTQKDPTKTFQREIKKTLNHSNLIVKKDDIWKYTSLNPAAPNLSSQLKIHKTNTPIRPVVNWKTAPAYKAAKLLNTTLQKHFQLPNAYNVKSPTLLIKDLKEITYTPDLQLTSFDIENMYTSIPTDTLLEIIDSLSQTHIENKQLTLQIHELTKTILDQNYFKFLDSHYIQRTGLAMGAPTSSILSEIFLQHMESNYIIDILTKNKVTGYFRYVDDILIVTDKNTTDIDEVFTAFNNINPNIKFTMEKEKDNKLNFLDITIQKDQGKLKFGIYRKPTTTDTIIPHDSCHPPEQKLAAIRHLMNRMNKYELDDESMEQEKAIIKQIITTNKYDKRILENTKTTKPKNAKKPQHTKWATLSYCGKESKQIAKLFKDTSINISFTTNNTIKKLLTRKPDQRQTQYDDSGVYKLTCPDCHMNYVGQTGRPLRVRYNEHLRDYRHNTNKSKFAQHLTENRHSFGPIDNVMTILHKTEKGRLMDTMERYYIYKETKINNQINDKNTLKPNIIFETIVQEHTNRSQA